MSSALDARPKLREELTVVRRERGDRTEFVVKEPDQKNYYRFGPPQVALMRLMDGERTPAELAEAARSQLGAEVSAGQIADFAHKLKRLGLVERTPAERHLMLMERLRKKRKLNTRGGAQGSLLRLRYSVGDPNELFEELVDRLSWMWTPGFVALSVVLFACYGGAVALNWQEFAAGAAGLYTFSGYGLADWALLWVIFVVLGVVHELGHGLTTKYFGGDVHEIGAMLLYFSPAMFCDTNDAWTFKERSHRLWVTFAGPWIELALSGVAALVWVVTEPGTFVHTGAFLAVVLGGFSAVLSNANPLIPLDGYYALSDWLEIPNLRGRAFKYWRWIGKRYLLGIDAEPPRTTPRERRVFLLYGGLALAYSAVLAVVGLLWLVMLLRKAVGPWAWVIVGAVGVNLLAGVRKRVASLSRTAVQVLRARLKERRRAAAVGGGALLLLGLPFLVPWPYRASGRFRVEAWPQTEIRAQVSGVLEGVHVAAGDTVRGGARLVTIANPDLEVRLAELSARAGSLAVARRRAAAEGERAEAEGASRARRSVLEQLAILRDRAGRRVVRAPFRGIVLADRLDERVGERVRVGQTLLRLANPADRVARARLPVSESDGLAEGQAAAMRLPARPDLEFRGEVRHVAPVADGDSVEAVVPIPGGDWTPPPGAVGRIKIATGRGSVGEALLRAIRHRIRIDLWL